MPVVGGFDRVPAPGGVTAALCEFPTLHSLRICLTERDPSRSDAKSDSSVTFRGLRTQQAVSTLSL